ncbi:MAG: hypothetical protein JWR80_7272 [Bradyrhizobium sp.]|nr:hypothetical protein [Bradyrhizobium sp.]
MVQFFRSFIRKRMVSLATTASVAAASFALAEDPARTDHGRRTMPIQYVANGFNDSEEQPFHSENAAAMIRRMAEMTIKPRHRGAVDMAKAEPRYGHNSGLR